MLRGTLKDFVVLPHRDKYGRRVVVFKMWDANQWSFKRGMESFYVIMLLLAREPKTQIAGVTIIGDYSGMSRKHMATKLEDIKAWANLISVIPLHPYLMTLCPSRPFLGRRANMVPSVAHLQRALAF